MSELLPCPFCGGEAVFHDCLRPPETFPCRVYCDNCWAEVGGYSTKAEAIAAWNTRAERTCKNAYEYRDSNGVLHRDARIFKCSECGFKVNDFYGDDEQNFPNYCPNCGRKVIA